MRTKLTEQENTLNKKQAAVWSYCIYKCCQPKPPPSIKHLKGKKKDKQQCTTHYFKLLLFYIANRASHRTVCSGDPLSYVLNVTIVVSHNKLLEFEGRKYTYEMHSATSQCLAHTLWETVRPKNCSEEQMHLASHWNWIKKSHGLCALPSRHCSDEPLASFTHSGRSVFLLREWGSHTKTPLPNPQPPPCRN